MNTRFHFAIVTCDCEVTVSNCIDRHTVLSSHVTICLYTGVRTAKTPFRNGRNCNTNSQRHTQLSQKI